MYCLNCGTRLQEGSLRCDKCGHAVELVPIYEDLDEIINTNIEKGIQKEDQTDINKLRNKEKNKVQEENNKDDEVRKQKKQKKQEEKLAESERLRREKQGKQLQNKTNAGKQERSTKKKKNKKIIRITAIILGLCICGILIFVYQSYITNTNSYDYQIEMATRSAEAGKYPQAYSYALRAQELEPDAAKPKVLQGRAFIGQKRYEAAIEILKNAMDQDPNDRDAYEYLIKAYEENQILDEIAAVMEACPDKSIEQIYPEYVSYPLSFSIEEGYYKNEISLAVSSKGGTIYYTLDGSKPDEDSILYTEAIKLTEGQTTVKAVCYNEYSNPGVILEGEYTIEIDPPPAPIVTPSSGSFTTDTWILVIVPDGCTAYYTFDGGTPTEESEVYEGSIEMPMGDSIFQAILVDEHGKVSEITAHTYSLYY